MAVYSVINVEIKQTKMNLFCFHLKSSFQYKQFDYTCTAKVCHGEIEYVYHIGVTSHFAYVELRKTWSIFAIPLDFEIARLTWNHNLTLKKIV